MSFAQNVRINQRVQYKNAKYKKATKMRDELREYVWDGTIKFSFGFILSDKTGETAWER